MDDKFMYIPNYDKQNYLFCRIKLVIETFKHIAYLFNPIKIKLMKFPKLRQQIR